MVHINDELVASDLSWFFRQPDKIDLNDVYLANKLKIKELLVFFSLKNLRLIIDRVNSASIFSERITILHNNLNFFVTSGFLNDHISLIISYNNSVKELEKDIITLVDLTSPMLDETGRSLGSTKHDILLSHFTAEEISLLLNGLAGDLGERINKLIEFVAPMPGEDGQASKTTKFDCLLRYFSMTDITSMLYRAGSRFAENIETLFVMSTLPMCDDQARPLGLTKCDYLIGKGFTSKQIASMLSSPSNRLAENMQALMVMTVSPMFKRGEPQPYTTFKYLIQNGLTCKEIASKLSGSRGNLTAAIEALADSVATNPITIRSVSLFARDSKALTGGMKGKRGVASPQPAAQYSVR